MQQLLRAGVWVLACLALVWLLLNKLPPDSWPGRGTSDAQGANRSETIRIASFNIQAFGQSKLHTPDVMRVVVDIVRGFDVVAIQEVRSESQNLLPQFVDMINAEGRKYDFALGPRLGRSASKEQYAFVFDTERVEIDRRYVYTVADRGDRLHREPLVVWFRVRGPPAHEAFTFTLVNVHTDPDEVASELDALHDAFRAVQNDGRGEDDVILLGDLNARNGRLGQLGRLPYLVAAIADAHTNTRQTKQYDNILFQSNATCEFTGRSGVLNFTREYQLTPEQALKVSDHLPIWAEFSVYEGGHAQHVARRAVQQR